MSSKIPNDCFLNYGKYNDSLQPEYFGIGPPLDFCYEQKTREWWSVLSLPDGREFKLAALQGLLPSALLFCLICLSEKEDKPDWRPSDIISPIGRV